MVWQNFSSNCRSAFSYCICFEPVGKCVICDTKCVMLCYSLQEIRRRLCYLPVHVDAFLWMYYNTISCCVHVFVNPLLCHSVFNVQNIAVMHDNVWNCTTVNVEELVSRLRSSPLYSNICKGPSVQLPLSPKFAVKKTHTNFCRDRQSICIGFRPFVPEELDMNLTSLKVGIHRHCSINKLN